MALKELFILAVAVLSFVRVVTCDGIGMCVPPLPDEEQIQWKNLNEEHTVELNADNPLLDVVGILADKRVPGVSVDKALPCP
ncbi:hypothetical protein TNIN_267161 [Trichonephila inaurata madagascariensis]|uniref:Uncharacterized protein n=1 Tax=Trichonephila inaurata madagascariensis TaxID=2747483 RepID=A0A8X6KE88_9ARAC|nr:hypothetical protein TNIN_267161 [Trichonephila inaurata madagascariensis]